MEGIIREEVYECGQRKSALFCKRNVIVTPFGQLIPKYQGQDVRQKYRSAVEYYASGALKCVYLQNRTTIETPIGVIDAELVTFYENGALCRVFPLYGQISAYWSEEEEAGLENIRELHVGKHTFVCKPRCLHFTEEGVLQSITIWKTHPVAFPTDYGIVETKVGIAFYPDGAIESVEPSFETILCVEGKAVRPFDYLADGLHADYNSLVFSESGKIKGIRNHDRETYYYGKR